MSCEVIWEPEALTQAERLATDGPDGVRQVFTAAGRLAGSPRPGGASGSAGLLCVHVAACRVMYGVSGQQSASASSVPDACAGWARRLLAHPYATALRFPASSPAPPAG